MSFRIINFLDFLWFVFVMFLLFAYASLFLLSQIHREFRKPLIVMSPKNLLRHKDCKSNLSEFDDVQGHPGFDKQGTRFKRLIKDQNNHPDLDEGIRRLVLCSGKVRLVHFGPAVFITFIWFHQVAFVDKNRVK